MKSLVNNLGRLCTQIKVEFITLRKASKHERYLITVLALFAYIEIGVSLCYILLLGLLGKDLQFSIILNSVVNAGLYIGGANYLLRLEDRLNKGEI